MSAWRTTHGVRHTPVRDGEVCYLPVAPTAQPGRLLVAGETAFLQLSAQWDPPAADLEALRVALTRDGVVPRLAPPAGLAVPRAELHVGDEVVQAVPTSGFPPWTALFAVALAQDHRNAVRAALSGEPGRGRVRFCAELAGGPHELDLDLTAFGPTTTPVPVAAPSGLTSLGRFDRPPATLTERGAGPC